MRYRPFLLLSTLLSLDTITPKSLKAICKRRPVDNPQCNKPRRCMPKCRSQCRIHRFTIMLYHISHRYDLLNSNNIPLHPAHPARLVLPGLLFKIKAAICPMPVILFRITEMLVCPPVALSIPFSVHDAQVSSPWTTLLMAALTTGDQELLLDHHHPQDLCLDLDHHLTTRHIRHLLQEYPFHRMQALSHCHHFDRLEDEPSRSRMSQCWTLLYEDRFTMAWVALTIPQLLHDRITEVSRLDLNHIRHCNQSRPNVFYPILSRLLKAI